MLYRYAAYKDGQRIKGEMEAGSPQDVLKQLREQGLTPIQVSPKRTLGVGGGQPTRQQIISFSIQLRQLISAGVPIISALENIRDSSEGTLRTIVADIVEQLKAGQSFSQALASKESVFGEVYVALIKVGEKTGRLDSSLQELIDLLEWEEDVAARAKKIIIYPSIVLVVVTTVVIVLMLFVVPKLTNFIQQMGGEIPWTTRALIATSDFIANNLMWIFITPVLLFFIVRYFYRKNEGVRYKIDCLILKIPLIGEVLNLLKLARFSKAVSLSFSAGIGFVDSLDLARRVVASRCIESQVIDAMRKIEEGSSIYESLASQHFYNAISLNIIKAGESSGQLDESFKVISSNYDFDAKRKIDKLEPAIEPVLTVVLAMIVLWIMMAIMGPVYDTISKIQI
ncbi:type II secretion system F family protein [Candidatus Parcubacteria bacterium]|nr:MAG: type II secretion system F family protein [Candidatus Parcubacteria bacterium]